MTFFNQRPKQSIYDFWQITGVLSLSHKDLNQSYDLQKNFYQYLLHQDQLKEFFSKSVRILSKVLQINVLILIKKVKIVKNKKTKKYKKFRSLIPERPKYVLFTAELSIIYILVVLRIEKSMSMETIPEKVFRIQFT
ncbi:hypothetical protein BpHYR1_019591 [Brachionus plicatilis]|uniref:Uncharacterized protein n=1 Tax=Brachionus plicatilis TaxID=10195 RepID=A0A3M7SIF4_BRAPC|nr:hypothetical protein BpHYR1_019591 [Brachionus plicatilis]